MGIDMDDVSFTYKDGTDVLHDISVVFEEPGLNCIIGPNGVGKSTLIRCMNKILKPTAGVVTLNGGDVTKMKYKEISQHIGYVPVNSEDMFPMTVFDTVLLGRSPKQGWTPNSRDLEIVYDLLHSLGIEELAMRSFNELSAGQHQRVAIARGLAQEPEILILDEPTANLDVKHQVNVLKLLKRMAQEKHVIIVMVSHDLNISARYADRVILMSEPGVVKQIGTAEEVLTEANIESVYGVKCRIEMIEGKPYVAILDSLDEVERCRSFDHQPKTVLAVLDADIDHPCTSYRDGSQDSGMQEFRCLGTSRFSGIDGCQV